MVRLDVLLSLTRLAAAAIHMAWTSGQLGGSVLVYDMGKLPSTCLQTIEDDIFDASPLQATAFWRRGLDPNPRNTTHGPRVFSDKEPNTSINPDEAVEYSAAVQGASHR